MAVDKVVLINAVSYFGDSITSFAFASEGESNLGLKTIKEALSTAGFNNIVLLPTQPLPLSKFCDNTALEKELKKEVRSSENVVFGISSTTDHYNKVEPLVYLIRRHFPDSKIVLGGPYFNRENLVGRDGKRYRDSVEIALEKEILMGNEGIHRYKLADAVNVGHAQGFIDFIIKHNGNLEDVVSKGFYRLDPDGKVIGEAKGAFPEIRTIPYSESDGEIGMMIDDLCGNLCDFCSIPGGIHPNIEIVTKSLIEAFKDKAIDKLLINSSNPWKRGVTPYYEKILSDFDRAMPHTVYKASYLDPASLTTHFDALIKFFSKHNFYCFHVGRDVITGDNAKFAGTKINGVIRNQEELNAEKKALKQFIRELGKRRKPGAPKYKVVIHYIMTPVETKKSATAMVREIEEFNRMSNKNVETEIKVFSLCPEPGTEVQRRHLDYIRDPEDFWLRSTYMGDWKYEMGPASYLLDRVGILMGAYDLTIPQKSIALRRMIKDAFSGRIPKLDKSMPDALRLSLGTVTKDFAQPWHNSVSGRYGKYTSALRSRVLHLCGK